MQRRGCDPWLRYTRPGHWGRAAARGEDIGEMVESGEILLPPDGKERHTEKKLVGIASQNLEIAILVKRT